jgi:hypothetical protein
MAELVTLGERIGVAISTFFEFATNKLLYLNGSGTLDTADFAAESEASSRVWEQDGAGAFRLSTYVQHLAAELGEAAENDMTLGTHASTAVMIQRTKAEDRARLAGGIEYPIYATGMTPRTTAGAARLMLETATNDVMLEVLAFDPSADEGAQFRVYLPKGFNAGTVTARFKWSHPSTSTNFDVTWAIQARAFTNDDALDQAFGTAIVVSDAGGTTGDEYISAETAAITIAGTPTGQKTAIFQVYRDVDGNGTAGNDDLAVDAYLHEVVLTFTMSSITDD